MKLSLKRPDVIINYKHLSIVALLLTIAFGIVYSLLIQKRMATNKALIRQLLTFSFSGILVLILIAAITGGSTDGGPLLMNLEYSYLFITAIIAGLIMIFIGLIMMVINLILSLINTFHKKA